MKIDFYILDDANRQQAWLYTCKLIENLYAENKQVYVYTASNEEADKIDELLWTYRDDSFIPHEIDHRDANAPIRIGHEQPQANMNGTLVNLSTSFPAFYAQFNHIIEIVFSDATMQQLARDRYRQYRDTGIELNTHKLKANAL